MRLIEGEVGGEEGVSCAPRKKLVGFWAILNDIGARQNGTSNIIYLP
jgi:hypothetical protein